MSSNIPTRVFFFGAGASKSCGLPMATELYDVLVNPKNHHVGFARSKVKGIEERFNKKRAESLSIIALLSNAEDSGLNRIESTFNILSSIISGNSEDSRVTKSDADKYFKALSFCFDIILHPVYNTRANSLPYSEFSYNVINLPGWSMMVSTNWDYLLDVHLDTAAGQNLFVDWGIGSPNTQPWKAHIGLMAQYSWEEHKRPYISLYKPNGSLGWYRCPCNNMVYARHFYKPYNLDQIKHLNEMKRLDDLMNGVPRESLGHPLGCPECGTPLAADFLHVPGVVRTNHPLNEVMFINLKKAVLTCDEITFIGYSCPEEDKDLINYISEALKENDAHNQRTIVPNIVDIKGSHNARLIDTYETALGRKVTLNTSGFTSWMHDYFQN